MLDKLPLHPVLLGIFPVVCIFTRLIDYVLPEEIILPLTISLALTALGFGISFLLIRNVQKAAIVTSAAILLNVPFDILSLALDNVTVPLGWFSDDRVCLIPYLIFAGFLLTVLAKSKSEFKILTSFLNVVGVVLIVGNVGFIIVHELTIQEALAQVDKRQEKIVLKNGQERNPDVYYVILDAMARTDTLKEFYDFDNTSFIEELKKRGFVVPARSKSNYQMTGLSLPSSLNMEYINFLSDIVGKDCKDHAVLNRLIQRNRLTKALQAIGYKFVNIRSGYTATDYIPEADVNLGPSGNIFQLAILRSTLAGPFLLEPISQSARNVRTFAFNHAEEIMREPSPKFVFAHLGMPHPPFLFKEDGQGLTSDRISMSEPYTKEKYVNQVKFVQSRLLLFIDQLAGDPAKKAIILQADHGPSIQLGADGDPSASYLRERMRIFNAYKLPGIEDDTIYDGITPVNSFRVVLNKYFGAGLPILADECYYSPSGQPLTLTNVTKFVTP